MSIEDRAKAIQDAQSGDFVNIRTGEHFFQIADLAECRRRAEIEDILQAMLSQSSPAWQITEERQAALKVAVGDLDLSENIGYLSELRAMLDEVK